MKKMWVVTLTKPMERDNFFREGFFPRKVYYENEANRLAAEVRQKGGDVSVEKEK